MSACGTALSLCGFVVVCRAALPSPLALMSWRGGEPEGYTVYRDLPYAATDNPRQTLDLAVPKKIPGETHPVLVFIHGGGWQRGSKDRGLSWMSRYLDGRLAAVSIGYRLSGEAQWPAQLYDCKAAIRWIRAHAAEYNLDPDRIAVSGASAGGHLASMVGLTQGMAALEGNVGPDTNESSRVTCVINFFGPSELLTLGKTPAMDHDAPDAPEAKLFGGPMQEKRELARAASPLTYVRPGAPPFLIVHGDRDRLIPFRQSVQLDERLGEAGVPSRLVKMIGGHHGFQNRKLDERLRLFIQKYLYGEDVSEVSEEPIDLTVERWRWFGL